MKNFLTLATILVASGTALASSAKPRHPLDDLTADEYWTVHDVLENSGHLTQDTLVASLLLREPPKKEVLDWRQGKSFPREADVVLTEGGKTFEAVVNISKHALSSWKLVPGVQAPFTRTEVMAVGGVIMSDPRVIAALKRRHLHLSDVHCAAEPMAFPSFPEYENQRVAWGGCFDFHGAFHAWGRSIGGLMILTDIASKKVLQVVDTGPTPMPRIENTYEQMEAIPREGTTPIEVQQPQGPSFRINQGEVSWQNWQFRFRIDPRLGPILNLVGYQDGGKRRSVLYEGSLSEMYVPYMDTEEGWNSRAYLDLGEWHMDGSAKPLSLEDCPANASFFGGIVPTDHGTPAIKSNLACMFERATGDPAWRHYDYDMTVSRPSRELVLRSAVVMSNYDYLIDWVFQQDGTIRIAVGATGILDTKPTPQRSVPEMSKMEMTDPEHGTLIAPNLIAVNHDHYFSFRLDIDVDGPKNSFMLDRLVPQKVSARARTSIWAVESSIVKSEKDAVLDIDARKPAMWDFISSNERDSLGHPTGYEIMPGANGVSIVAPDDPAQKAGAFSAHTLWVTPYSPDEIYAAGKYVTNRRGGDGLPSWIQANRKIQNTDIVAWYTLGFHHVPRTEDWPVMPTLWHDFMIRPMNFFTESPVLSLPHRP